MVFSKNRLGGWESSLCLEPTADQGNLGRTPDTYLWLPESVGPSLLGGLSGQLGSSPRSHFYFTLSVIKD